MENLHEDRAIIALRELGEAMRGFAAGCARASWELTAASRVFCEVKNQKGGEPWRKIKNV